ETQDDLFPADELLRIGLQQIELAQRRPRPEEKRPPRLRQPHTVSAAIEQREAELLLEPGDRHEHRWVRSVQRGAGSLEASLGRDSVEAAQIVELDPIHYP
ncbi:hypothetical protein chiPu_0033516, partial [Chiloscyllium punctatum]|nr:hypothetical protein [Chiloscyllium punctatum]